ncbi:MAG: gliding motility-associated C-terminal domain-containing protein [Saprospiraceae bacterium]|nr:gliding motility-associated C-terminal domain-containing protein [Saprospiraceae bacterium]
MSNFYAFCFIWIFSGLTWLWVGTSDSRFQMVEICENAKDDDGDGLIDLNDPDCDCPVVEPISLIPNPSFEKMNCCPMDRSQLDCAETWIQASEATTDYLHRCGWFGWPHLPPPQPIPDGDAVIGFRNGRFGNNNNSEPGWKEYTGACLLSPLKAGTTYRFRFHIGFLDEFVSPSTNVVFYGTTDCKNLPFGLGNAGYGCPTNGPGWKELGRAPVYGLNEWIIVNLTVTPTENITAIAIGPDCVPVSATGDIYYFFDNLILADQRDFDFEISAAGHPCAEEFSLQIPPYDSLQYQWFKNGIALVGETKPKLQVKTGEGDYQVRILSSAQCKVTKPYSYRIPNTFNEINKVICKDDTYAFQERRLNKTGVYWDTLKTVFNCDSIIKLNLRIADDEYDTVRVKIFPGEFYQIGRVRYKQEGDYDAVLQSVFDCDSLIYLELELYHVFVPNAFSPNDDGSNDHFTIFGGDDLIMIKNLQIFNRWGNQVFQRKDFAPNDMSNGWDGQLNGKPVQSGVYVYIAQVLMDDGKERQLTGALTLLK